MPDNIEERLGKYIAKLIRRRIGTELIRDVRKERSRHSRRPSCTNTHEEELA